ncbi:alpha/beta fold hydrolase [Tianweitania sp. BSSL-BM11]|uniref:Alpha/beta fold hydrolase n=1 Tax=Tianweitania aestuarii TaxID=2814886 RepID=A0ABS5RQ37_9HYPH|nr:alpha/beta fold hydrolase [Tianweitania aestuarii]MBS9719154.1 alpha/beta fold hydrolase [Tianweitania aestuarii]
MNNLIDKARHIPVADPAMTISFSPVALPAPKRGMPLELRITAPASGDKLPIILLSHGHGPSLYLPSKDGYGPLANFWAERGFAVIQPTHANSKVAGLPSDAPGAPLFWRTRVEEMKLILDQLDTLENMIPVLAGRLDHDRIAVAGHSLGGQTAAMLLGARLTDSKIEADRDVDVIEPRIKAGVLLAAPGNGGKDLNDFAAENYTALNPDYTHLTTQTLVVYGDEDVSPHLTVRGADWHADAFYHAPGADSLLTLFGAKHGLGGVAGYDAKEADDEDPDRLEATRRLTWAYLRSALYKDDPAWANAVAALAGPAGELGRVDSKSS